MSDHYTNTIKLNMPTKSEVNVYDRSLPIIKRKMLGEALYKAIQDLGKDTDINILIKAMQVKLETLILTDDYANPKRGWNHKTHINGLDDRQAIWNDFEYLFHLLDHGDFNDVAMQTIKIFYRLDAEVTDQQHYKQIRKHVAKLLDYCEWIEVMDHLKERNL